MREIDTHTANTHLVALECTHEATMDVNASIATVDELEALVARPLARRSAMVAAIDLANCDHTDGDVNCPLTHIGV